MDVNKKIVFYPTDRIIGDIFVFCKYKSVKYLVFS